MKFNNIFNWKKSKGDIKEERYKEREKEKIEKLRGKGQKQNLKKEKQKLREGRKEK